MDKFMDILNELCLEDSPEMDYLLLPATPIHMRPLTIDWRSITYVFSSEEGCNNHFTKVWTKDDKVCSCKLEDSLVYTPHNSHFYVITGRMELDGNSLLRVKNGKAMTYKNYCKEKYGIHLRYENQQLYNGRHKFHVKNYNLKSRQAKERESTKASAELPPELCSIIISPISISTIYSFSFVPSIIHRLESLLLASNLKRMFKQNDNPTFKILEAITAKESVRD
ncbi:hypothetical protein K1719_011265 [Acacia pycnantha]|nr:hypothetical protein K1719_011265 [Acacia pycnantha]